VLGLRRLLKWRRSAFFFRRNGGSWIDYRKLQLKLNNAEAGTALNFRTEYGRAALKIGYGDTYPCEDATPCQAKIFITCVCQNQKQVINILPQKLVKEKEKEKGFGSQRRMSEAPACCNAKSAAALNIDTATHWSGWRTRGLQLTNPKRWKPIASIFACSR
jgi:hypothetical protein